MAYSKQTWTDDVSAVTGARMTHIEQGIYDNSLATDKINPSGTATTTAEIEEGQITDVIGFKSLKLKGQTSQYTTTGKNIFPRITFSQTINGVTITATGDGTIKIKGTANSSGVNHPIWGAWASSTTLFTIPAGTYTASGIGTRQASPRMNIVTNGTTSIFVNNTTQTLDSDTNVTGIFIWVDAGTTVDTTFKPMIETGSSATSYEPYTGKKASPNPDFPQDVKNVSGDNIIEISNINMLDESKLRQGAYIKATNNTRLFIDSNNYLEVGTYTVVTNLDLTKFRYGADVASTPFPLDVGKPIDIFDAGWITNSNHLTFSITQRGYLGVGISKTNASNNITPSEVADYWFMVYKGTYDSNITYQEHQGNNFEINLGKNLIEDETFVQGSSSESTGTKRISCRNTKLKRKTTYTLSSNLDFNVFNIAIATSTSEFPTSSIIYDSGWKTANFSFTTGNDDVYANIIVKKIGELTIAPSDVKDYHFQLEEGNQVTPYISYFPPIELCEIGTNRDYIYKKDGIWFKHKEIKKAIFNGNSGEGWALNSSGTYYKYQWSGALPDKYNVANTPILCNYFQQITVSEGDAKNKIGIANGLYSGYSIAIVCEITTLSDFKTWLSENNVIVYYPIATPIEEEIIYTPLIRQLDELYNSGLYDVTNISQDNSSEAFILDIEACKNNINGIVEYIRR